MPDAPKNDAIDLDALIDTLLKEKQPASPAEKPETKQEIPEKENDFTDRAVVFASSVAVAAPDEQDSGVSVKADIITGENEPENGKTPAAEPESPSAPQEDERPRRKRSLRRRAKKEHDGDFDPMVEQWADWGLKPIGHYRAEKREINADVPQQELLSGDPSKAPGTEHPPAPEHTDTVDVFPAVMPVTQSPAGEIEPIGQTDEPAAPAENAAMAETPAPAAPTPVVLPEKEAMTRVLPDLTQQPAAVSGTADATDDAAGTSAAPQAADDGQISLSELVPAEEPEEETPPTDDDDMAQAEEQLRLARQEKIRDFTLDGEIEEENEPEEEPDLPEEEPIIDDYRSPDDAAAVRLELQYRSRTALWSMLVSGVLTVISLLLTLLTVYLGRSPITDIGYLTVQAFVLGLMLVLDAAGVGRGLNGLFVLRANNDTAPAVTGILSLAGVLLHFADINAALPLWPPLAALGLLLSAVSGYLRAQRVREDFTFVSYPGEKYAAALIDEQKALREIGRRVVVDDEASVVYFRRSAFLSDHLKNAYEDDRSDDWMRVAAPVFWGLSLAVSLALTFGGAVTGFWRWLELFLMLLCMTSLPAAIAVQLPLRRCSRRMLAKGGFIVGWKAVRELGSPDALIVDVADLYPDECMLLHGIKTFGGMHIDDAILDAASLSIRSGGPLSLIFRRIIQNKLDILREVDSLVYEQGMGLSGWVDGRRVLVGDRRLLENHGVDVPSADYEARYAKNGRRLVYLSTAGELSAMFVVTYLPDDTIAEALRDLCRAHVTILVRSCDQNITAAQLCSEFGLDEYYVDVLPASAGRLYDRLVDGPAEQTPAVMASNGHILGTALALSSCRDLKIRTLIALLVQTVGAAIALLFCAVWASVGSADGFLPLLAVSVAVPALSLALPLLRR